MGHDSVLARNGKKSSTRGQAIIMVVLGLFAMFGMLGLAVDFGWAYFVKRAAQGAADTAAIAAAEEMRRMVGFTGPYPCLNGGTCRDDSAPYVCGTSVVNDTADNLDNACLYAKDNGFVETGHQRVRVSEGSAGEAPTVPGITFQYWVTVRVTETVPQLFAAMTGNPIATVSARATAAIYLGQIRGSIILLNRDSDVPTWGSGNPAGRNIEVNGNSTVTAGGGILMASSCNGGNCGGVYAGYLQGASTAVTAPYTNIREAGWYDYSGGSASRWSATPTNGYKEGSEFQDPFRKKSQIPVSDAGLADCPIQGGVIEPQSNGGTVNLGPGNYYATYIDRNGNQVPTGEPIKVNGNINFRSSGSCRNGSSNANGYGTYVFYGGLSGKNSGSNTNLSFESGTVVLAGALPSGNGNNQSAGALFDLSVGGNAFSITGPGSSAAGNVFVYGAPGYPGLSSPPTMLTNNPTVGSSVYVSLMQGTSGFKSGNNQSVSFTLDGLNANSPNLPPELKPYNATVMWQDRRNSTVNYNSDGTYACAAPYVTGCSKTSQQLTADKVLSDSPGLFIAAGANTVIRGTMYQPRGAWATLQGSTGMTSALQLITGALRAQGGNNIQLNPVTTSPPVSIVGLVE